MSRAAAPTRCASRFPANSAKAGLASEDVKDTLDLCVSCKGCKRDCPTGVDMAKIKIEARAARVKRTRLPSARPAGGVHAALCAVREPHAGSDRARPSNVPVLAGWFKRAVGFAPERTLAALRKSFLSTAVQLPAAPKRGATKEVLLFVDTFNNNMEPDNARAAQQRAGSGGLHGALQHARRASGRCAAGARSSPAGLVDEAKAGSAAHARHIAAVRRTRRAGCRSGAVVPAFVARRIPATTVSAMKRASFRSQAFLFEEFLVREERGRDACSFRLKPLAQPKALVHGHCHQKAFDAFTPVQTVLRLDSGAGGIDGRVVVLRHGGSFGYEAEHYETSKAMAELSLLPAVRKTHGDTVIVADGTSCRHQIADGTDAKALHVAQVLAAALRDY